MRDYLYENSNQMTGRWGCFIFFFTFILLFPAIAESKGLFDTTIKSADALPEQYISMLMGKRVGLIINQTAKVGDSSLLDILLKRGVHIVKIFVPEHGFRGTEDAGAHIDNMTDSATGLRVISLYGSHKKPTDDDMADADVLVYDLQDVGVRFYTYISTLQYCLEACAEQHKTMVVLDRPDPNGFYVDGPVMENENRSFVGMQAIPVVYGMTAGEYAEMLVGEGWLSTKGKPDVKVIKCQNYEHRKKYLLPVAPSPNLRNMAAIYAYPSLCLFEGTKVSVGRGTAIPFQQYGCPEFEGKFSYSFTPESSAGAKSPLYEHKLCYGERIGDRPEEVVKIIGNKLQLGWIIKAYNAYPDTAKFFNNFFIKLSGTGRLENQVKNGVPEKAIRAGWAGDLERFKKIRKKYLLYKDFE